MITMGIKLWENRAAMPSPPRGCCAMTCSKSSDAREYANFLAWAARAFKPEAFASLPRWDEASGRRGMLVAVCDYEASSALRRIRPSGMRATPCGGTFLTCGWTSYFLHRGNVGMWRLPEDVEILLDNMENRTIDKLGDCIR